MRHCITSASRSPLTFHYEAKPRDRSATYDKCYTYRFTTYQDARRVRLVDGLETNILRVSPVKTNAANMM